MIDKQKEFLKLAVVELKTYQEISSILNIPSSELSKWWEELKTERVVLAKIRDIWKRKFTEFDFWKFHAWIESTPKSCHYCKIREDQIQELWIKDPNITKRKRGRILEIDRKEPNESYDNIDNLVLACYWCNNAKTDTFTEEEFMVVGKAISKVWEQRLSNDNR